MISGGAADPAFDFRDPEQIDEDESEGEGEGEVREEGGKEGKEAAHRA